MANIRNVTERYAASVVFVAPASAGGPFVYASTTGTYGEVVAWLADQQASEYPISSASLHVTR